MGKSDLENWISCQILVCGLIIYLPTSICIHLIIKKKKEEEKELKCDDLWRPCWRNMNPLLLLLYRLTAFLFMSWLLTLMLLLAGPFAFYFYTQWTLALVILYFGIGVVISAQGCFLSCKKPPNDRSSNPSILKPCLLGNLMQIIYQTSAPASILTDLVFWCVLVPIMAGKQFDLTLLIGSIHSVNALFLILDSFLNQLPFEWFGFNYFILWTATYVSFHWILHACGSTWWPYPFLELSTPSAPLWYFGLAVIHVPCYGVYILLVKAKNLILSKLLPQAFVRSQKQVWAYKKEA